MKTHKMSKMEVLEIKKKKIIEIRNSIIGFNSILDTNDQRIGEL